MPSDETPDLEAQVSYYNRRWSEFDFANQLAQERCIFILESILATGIVQPRICDLGAGAGWLTSILGMFGHTVGVELSDQAVALARERYPNAQFICADALQWAWNGTPFDIVVSQEVIEHVPDQSAYVDVAHSILRPGGYLILTTPSLAVLRAVPERDRRVWLQQPVENILTRDQLRELIARRFRLVRISSRVLGVGSLGVHRIANSAKLHRLAGIFHAQGLWDGLRRRLGFGIHQVVVAQRIG